MSQGLIQGFMREAPLPDVIQLVSQGGKSGCFHVTEDARRAKIYLQNGRIVHAVSNEAEGLDAIFEVALWLDGQYRFEESSSDVPTTITKSNAALLMEMHRRMDEWRVISQKIPSLDLYPASTLLPGDAPVGVSPREAKLLSYCTGYYSVSELAAVLQKAALNVAKDVYGLVMANHVVMKGIRSGKRPDMPSGEVPVAAAAEPDPVRQTPSPVAEAPEPIPVSIPNPEPAPATASAPAPAAASVVDPVKVAKLTAFAQRIVTASKSVLPTHMQEQVGNLHAQAVQKISAGEGPEAVKNLALSISRSAVDAGLDAELVKNLNAQLKALFNK